MGRCLSSIRADYAITHLLKVMVITKIAVQIKPDTTPAYVFK